MNNDYYIEWGLHLPFRFYNDRNKISEATDYARQINIPKSEFLIMPYGVILPFQIVREFEATENYQLTFYCIDDIGTSYDINALYPAYLKYYRISARGDVDYISFLGIDPEKVSIELTIPTGGYYAVFTDGISTWYSENFIVVSEDRTEELVSETHRKWSNTETDIRTTDGSTLRIV